MTDDLDRLSADTERARRLVVDTAMRSLGISPALDALIAAVRKEEKALGRMSRRALMLRADSLEREMRAYESSLRLAEALRERIGKVLGRDGTPRENGWAATESTIEAAERVVSERDRAQRALDDRESEVLMLAAELDELRGTEARDALDLAKQRAAGLRRLLARLEPK